MRILGRFLLAAATGLGVLVAGVLSAVVLAGFAVWERAAPPGNRFLILEFIAIGVLLGAPMAIAVACWVLLRPGSHSRQGGRQIDAAFF
jgi:predicted small integral membrane protein